MNRTVEKRDPMTTEAFVAWAINRAATAPLEKYTLIIRTERVFDDPTAGEIWQKTAPPYVSDVEWRLGSTPEARHAVVNAMSLDDRIELERNRAAVAAYRAHEEARPPMHSVTRYALERQTRSRYYSGNTYPVDRETGELLQGVFGKAALSLLGILKRLGKTDAAKRVKAVQDEAARAQEKRARNWMRRRVIEAATELAHRLGEAGDVPGLGPENTEVRTIIGQLLGLAETAREEE